MDKTKGTELEEVQALIMERIGDARCGIFFSRNTVGDDMENIYDGSCLSLDICEEWGYFELFGLDDDEARYMKGFYDGVRAVCRRNRG